MRANARAAVVMAAAAQVLCSCATDQASDVKKYRAISDPPELPAPVRERLSLSLTEALGLTAAYNEQLAARGEQYIQALAQRQRAASALRPTLDLFVDSQVRENSGSSSVAPTDIGINGQYRVLTGMGDLRNVEAAESRIEARRWLILDLRESLLLETARAYYEILRAERLIRVLESSEQVQLARLDEARARNEVGFARPLDVAQIESQASRTRTQLITAQRQAAEARAVLSLLSNADLRGVVLSDGFSGQTTSTDPENLLSIARNERQDIAAARREAEAARAEVDAAISQYAPSITLNLDYFLLRSPDDSLATIAGLIQVRAPLFSAGRIEADVREAWSIFRQRVLEYRLREREAARDIRVATAQLEASIRRATELAAQVRVAREALELAEASYQAGLGTNLERIAAQDQLLAAELEATSEEFTGKVADLAVQRACGRLAVEMLLVPPAEPGSDGSAPPDSPFLDRTARTAGEATR